MSRQSGTFPLQPLAQKNLNPLSIQSFAHAALLHFHSGPKKALLPMLLHLPMGAVQRPPCTSFYTMHWLHLMAIFSWKGGIIQKTAPKHDRISLAQGRKFGRKAWHRLEIQSTARPNLAAAAIVPFRERMWVETRQILPSKVFSLQLKLSCSTPVKLAKMYSARILLYNAESPTVVAAYQCYFLHVRDISRLKE